jgi:hypothetical protein
MKWLALVLLLAVPCFADEEEAIAALKTSGVGISKGKTGYSIQGIPENISDARLKRLGELPVVSVETSFEHRADRVLKVLKDIPTIKHINLGGAGLRDDDLKLVGDMPSLTEVRIYSQSITDKGLLELARCKELKFVLAQSAKVTAAGREKLNDALPKCVVR